MNLTSRQSPRPSHSAFSLVEMIGVLAIIAILAAVIVPKVFSTIASSRVTSTVGTVNTMKTAVTEFSAKYGTIPLTVDTSRLDDLLVTAGVLDGRFTAKIGNPPAIPTRGGATWSNSTGTWVGTGGVSQITAPIQSRLISLMSLPTAVPGVTGDNYRLSGSTSTSLPVGARVVSAVLADVPVRDAIDLSLKVDGESLTQASTSVAADSAGRVTYAAAVGGLTTVYIYIAHQ